MDHEQLLPAQQDQSEQTEEQKQNIERKKRQFFGWLGYSGTIEDFSIDQQNSYHFYISEKEFNKLFEDLPTKPEFNSAKGEVTVTSDQIAAVEQRYKGLKRKIYAVLLTLLACALFAIASVYANPATSNVFAFAFGTIVASVFGIISLIYARKYANQSELLDSLHKNFKPKRGWLIAGGLVFAVSLILRIVSAQSFVAPLTAVLFGVSILVLFLSSLTIRKQKNYGFDSDQVAQSSQVSAGLSNAITPNLSQSLISGQGVNASSVDASLLAQPLLYSYENVSQPIISATSSIPVEPPQPLSLPQSKLLDVSATTSSNSVVVVSASASDSSSLSVVQAPPPAYSSLPPNSSSVLLGAVEEVEGQEGQQRVPSTIQPSAPSASLSNSSTPVAFSLSQHVLNP